MKAHLISLIVILATLVAASSFAHGFVQPTKKFQGWYGASGHSSELSGWNNAFASTSVAELIDAKAKYGFPQQLLAVEDTYIKWVSLPHGKHTLQLIPRWKEEFLKNVPVYSDLLANSTIVGFWFGDELMWNGFPFSSLVDWTNAFREKFPFAFLWENEATPVFGTGQAPGRNMNGEVVNVTKFAPALNATSIDLYDWRKGFGGRVVEEVQAYYKSHLEPRLNPGQKLFVVPGADGSTHNPDCSLECYDKNGAEVARKFAKWLEEDDLIIGAFPWTWRSCGKGCIPPKDEIGCRHLNLTKTAWQQAGRQIMNMKL